MNRTEIASKSQVFPFARAAVEVLIASVLLAVSAQISFTLPFSPVPVSLQTFTLFMIAAYLGPKKALYSVLAYLAEGAAGLPVFAHGAAGPLVLVGPRGGYLAGFAAAAWISALLCKRASGFAGYAGAFLAGNVAIYALGMAWLSLWMGIGPAFYAGVVPFLAGDLMKILAASATVKGIRS